MFCFQLVCFAEAPQAEKNNEDALSDAIYRKKRNSGDFSTDFGDLSARTKRGITKNREAGDFGDFTVRTIKDGSLRKGKLVFFRGGGLFLPARKKGITKKREVGDFGDFLYARRGITKKREAGDFGDFIARKPMVCVVDFGDLIYRKKRTAMLFESRDNRLVRRPKLRSQVSVLASRFWCRDRTFGPRVKAVGPVFETIILGSS